jgi:hypothetical protein
MPIQQGTFGRLPSKDAILEFIAEEKQHNADLISYLLYVIPVAERFGDRAYAVAAQSLAADGVACTAAQLKSMAEEMKTPDGQAKYAEQRRRHVMGHVCG